MDDRSLVRGGPRKLQFALLARTPIARDLASALSNPFTVEVLQKEEKD
jgi:hypothetical protein